MSYYRCLDPEKIIPISRSTTELFKTGEWAGRRPVHREKVSPCRAACPAGNNITQALLRASQGDFDGALGSFLEENPLPGVCGRVCYHPCQEACNRGEWDGEISIRALERAASEMGRAGPERLTREGENHPVAVIGSGPAGLSAAYHLARTGHPVTVLEAEREPGGLLRWGIPAYRLPEQALKKDLERILSLGIHLNTGTRVDSETIRELRKKYEALFIATGAHQAVPLDVPGIGLEGVGSGIQFLKEVRRGRKLQLPGRVTVIGGGNVAIDAALTALRLGADRVDLVSLEREEEMPAHERDREDAGEEGVFFYSGWGPRRIIGEEGRVTGLDLMRCMSLYGPDGTFSPEYDEGEGITVDSEMIIVAIGQSPDISFLRESGISTGPEGTSGQCGHSVQSPAEGIFIGGDVINARGFVAEAVAAGKEAALAIHLQCMGKTMKEERPGLLLGEGPSFSIHAMFRPREGWDPHTVVTFADMNPIFLDHDPKEPLPRRDPTIRRSSFEEINPGLDKEQAVRAAERCFFCGTCTQCDRCFIYCPEISIQPPVEGHRAHGNDESHRSYGIDSEHCKGCAVCETVCPRGVMKMGDTL